MKKIIYFLLLLSSIAFISCKKSLNEVPLSFYSPQNSYTNIAQFQAALANIYLGIRTDFYATADAYTTYDMFGIDADLADNRQQTAGYVSYFNWNTLNADNGFASKWWGNLYNLIAQANTIINRANLPAAQWSSTAQKNAIIGEAMFLRAFCYHFLGNIYGGVPLVVNETTVPKYNYVRTTQDSIFMQCQSDLQFATQWMPHINAQTAGRAPVEAAYHLLSEVYLSRNNYQDAIAAADSVINGSYNHLMTAPFGTWANFTFSGPTYSGPAVHWGDVYFDLFQDGNFNWVQGNKEAIWNIEQDPTILGGDNTDVNSSGGLFVMERWWGPYPWGMKDKNGTPNFLEDTLMGRPVGYLLPTQYADTLIWQYKGNWSNDIRNSQYNIQRTWYFTNPASKFYGQVMTPQNVATPTTFSTFCGTQFKKFVSAKHYDKFTDATSHQGHDNGRTYKDWYIMRLAETYLLRAEAYMMSGDNASAANDINTIRARANATPVAAGDVNIDLILAERARELYGEEFRLNTLMRTGKLVQYLMQYNGFVRTNGYTLDVHLNKMPIPNSVIQANTGAVMTQNPGY